MAEEKKEEIAVIEITEEYMKERIYEIRGQRVILDSDLSEIYGYTTKSIQPLYAMKMIYSSTSTFLILS